MNVTLINIYTRLTCLKCNWISETCAPDTGLKLNLPEGGKQGKKIRSIRLEEILEINSRTTLTDVFCGTCKEHTEQRAQREYNADILILELLRGCQIMHKGQLVRAKHMLPIDFPVKGIKLPGGDVIYQVVGACHHRGTLAKGHWTTKMVTSGGQWYELDDLKPTHIKCAPPGERDSTVTMILLVAENKLTQK